MGKEFGWLDSEIIHGAKGEPFVQLSDAAKNILENLGGTHILVSLTHLSTTASAVVIIINS